MSLGAIRFYAIDARGYRLPSLFDDEPVAWLMITTTPETIHEGYCHVTIPFPSEENRQDRSLISHLLENALNTLECITHEGQ